MENRGRKRTESVDQLPSDKRACSSSSELKPGSSNSSSPNTHMGSNNSATQECDMEASSSAASISGGETEKDSSTYGSCDSDESEKQRSDHHEREYSGDEEKFRKILTSLSDESSGDSGQLVALTQLCDVLSFCTDSEISSYTADSLSPALVRLANHESNPDIMLFSIRAITYLCDVLPRSSALLVRHDAVQALCARLMAIEYLDVAEQCLLALEKISKDQPLACLQAGAVMAVLNYIDFFSSSVQRIAINTVANICKKLAPDNSSHFMDAVPVLCNLLQYEDQKLVENIANCLIRITETVSHSSEMVDELCKHGLIHQVIPLIALNSQTSLSQSTYARLIGLLSKLASGSVAAVRTLLELNISSALKNILLNYDVSHSTSSALLGGDVNSNQVHEVLKFLNVLLPPFGGKRDDILVLPDNEKIFKEQPELLRRFGTDILPVLIQVVNGGANLHVCYGCVSVINKLVYVSRSDMLFDLLKNTNISSFLAGVFTRKDHHLLIAALNIVETILQELPDFYLSSFMKEGVVYAIDAILEPERFSHSMFPTSCNSQLTSSSLQKLNAKDAVRCLCYNLNICHVRSSEKETCKLEKDSVHTLAKHIKATYFATEPNNSEIGLTETLQKLRNFGAALSDMVNLSMNTGSCVEQEENLFHILRQIMMELSEGESVSTFEFIESGILGSLLNYFSNGQYRKGKLDRGLSDYSVVVLKRFAMFASLSLSSMNLHWEGTPLAVLVRKLQIALSSLENFPVILNHISKPRNVYAAIPTDHYTRHPCLKVLFVKEEGETALCDYSADVVNIEPFTSLDAIERFLWPKVGTRSDEDQASSAGKCPGQSEDIPPPLPSDATSAKGKDPSPMEVDTPGTQDLPTLGQQFSAAVEAAMKTLNPVTASTSGSASTSAEYPVSLSNEDTRPNLIFCLDGRQLDQSLTLYQAILQLQVKEEPDLIAGPKFWNEVYQVTYRKAAELKQSNVQEVCLSGTQVSVMQNYPGKFWQNVLCFSSNLTAGLPSNLEKSDPVYEILFLLKNLEVINKSMFHLMSHERVKAFSEGKSDDLDTVAVKVCPVPQTEFVSCKLTEKLEQQMGDPLSVSAGAMPSWCSQLIGECPFLFSFEARCKYFSLTAFGPSRVQPHASPTAANNNLSATSDRRSPVGSFPRKKFQVNRSRILDSAAQMMNLAHQKVTLEVEFNEEVGTGLGPTMEFYTLVSHEFQKVGLGMWREDRNFPNSGKEEEPGFVVAPSGLFPRPWSASKGTSNGIRFSEVMKKFTLFGKVVAKAVQDGRVLDVPLSKAFYKLLLDQELNIYDIQSIDPELGRVLLEFQALVDRKKTLTIAGSSSMFVSASCFRNTKIDDLCLDFTLPGYPDYKLGSGRKSRKVNMSNLEEYVSLVVDATVNSGISRQVEAFKSGFNKVFPITSLKIFAEEEIERLLCGERDAWTSNELLDHIKFDHGYTVSSPPIIYLLEIIKEFGREQQHAFVQFVTGAPRLPHGGLAALNPKMTVVRKLSNEWADGDLPSVMTCANYLKLPPYSSKDIMKERLLYAITEGQGSFHLS